MYSLRKQINKNILYNKYVQFSTREQKLDKFLNRGREVYPKDRDRKNDDECFFAWVYICLHKIRVLPTLDT